MALAGPLVLSIQVQTNGSLEKAVILHTMLTRMIDMTNDSLEKAAILHAMLTSMIDMVRSSDTLPPPLSHIKGM